MKALFTLRVLLFCVVICLPTLFTKAQIVYTDIEDLTPSASYTLDLNNDEVDDFQFQFLFEPAVVCVPLSSNAYVGNYDGTLRSPYALAPGEVICGDTTIWWSVELYGVMAAGSTDGFWNGQADAYAGLRVMVNGQYHYGWVRMGITAGAGSFTIMEYAYNTVPDECIYAGQTATSVPELTTQQVLMASPNPCSQMTTIRTTGSFRNATFSVYNMCGQLVMREFVFSSATAELSLEALPAGLYFVNITEDQRHLGTVPLIVSDEY